MSCKIISIVNNLAQTNIFSHMFPWNDVFVVFGLPILGRSFWQVPFLSIIPYWRELYIGTSVRCSSGWRLGRSTAGNDIVATIFICLFFSLFSPFFFLPVFLFPPSRPFLIEGVLGSKNLFSESCLERPKT